MRKLGILTALVGLVVLVLGARLGVKSVPDAQRYMRMRAM
jgi:hypothetical protein